MELLAKKAHLVKLVKKLGGDTSIQNMRYSGGLLLWSFQQGWYPSLLEEMVLFRTRNGSIPRFIYGTPKWFYIEPCFLVKGSIGQVRNPRVL